MACRPYPYVHSPLLMDIRMTILRKAPRYPDMTPTDANSTAKSR